jgi:hypothetical protein
MLATSMRACNTTPLSPSTHGSYGAGCIVERARCDTGHIPALMLWCGSDVVCGSVGVMSHMAQSCHLERRLLHRHIECGLSICACACIDLRRAKSTRITSHQRVCECVSRWMLVTHGVLWLGWVAACTILLSRGRADPDGCPDHAGVHEGR